MEVTTALQSEQHVKQELAKKLGQLQEQLGKLKDTVTPAPAEEARGTGTRLEGGRLGRDRRLGLGVGRGGTWRRGPFPACLWRRLLVAPCCLTLRSGELWGPRVIARAGDLEPLAGGQEMACRGQLLGFSPGCCPQLHWSLFPSHVSASVSLV